MAVLVESSPYLAIPRVLGYHPEIVLPGTLLLLVGHPYLS